ncbi:MAG: NADPH:quinone reductase or related Zn-dependent oxidoreductase [Chloroflexi bacterium AL-W]|nr:NADPH:quinone reductase or related Zn-dependent oxidoreductase [Chloroflexi bacterium AL-N1]NOK68308.1 NADPH:quinone reductase or related Zn-dependent oxidoreductase [Chloroflexi bacterium AL-N10]NOK73954.1 NADPH:quinone reductase or related Zn-dependent oxidoreductase [Chloroflexi bacterium AL-N5]NOK82922.1 NADPH:quinone reductase or related Zn-dependent oxidoreductase [Chloroflexi bacterium AL-W]NOK90444.1 NADPH:quinone reductase or related Zn-dependent oxidoreductase [Chloroflexi bacteriu
MKQVQLNAYGSADVLRVVEVDTPQPRAGDLLIEVEAAGVNFSDVLRRRNTYFMPTPLPYVLGAEAVGTIVAVGEGVPAQSFQLGQRVLAILPHGGGYSEYVTAAAQYCVPLPTHIAPADATAIFVQGSTAHLILHQVARDIASQTVLVHAAAGGVGSLLVQLAKLAGAKVIATGSSAEKLTFAQKLGADAAINYSEANWPAKVLEANGGEKVDFILEMVGGDVYTQSFACLKPGGTMIVYGAASGQKGMMHSEHFVDENHNLLSFNLAHFVQHKTDLWQASLGAMIGFIAEGQINIQTGDTFALSDVRKAHQQLEDRQTTGKVVLVP